MRASRCYIIHYCFSPHRLYYDDASGSQIEESHRDKAMKSADEDLLDGFLAGQNMTAPKRDSTASSWITVSDRNERTDCAANVINDIESDVNELVRQHAPALSRYAATIVRDNFLVQDAVQEAFLRYFIARTSGQQMENPRAWLFRVLRNYLLDCTRKSINIPATNLEEAVKVADVRQDVEAGYQQNECFQNALAILSPREKECILLRVEGFGYNEIAQFLRIRPGTVAALLARGLKKIRQSGKM
jgi:RNA polymerase sigma-70 factor, ECF subfamily